MRLVGAGLGVIWLGSMAGFAFAEEPSPAPLSAAGAEIRQLEKDQRRTEAAKGNAKVEAGSVPKLNIDPAQDSPEAWLAEQKKKEREEQRRGTPKREKQDNWLVDGVESLKQGDPSPQAPAAAKASSTSDASSASSKADQSDPNYLLKLFAEQKKDSATEKSSAKPERGPDPFAPFLQGWLGNSPVRGQFFDQFATGNTSSAGGSATAPSGSGPAGSSLSNANPLADLKPAAKERSANPYLETAPVLSLALPAPVSNGSPVSPSLGNPALNSEAMPAPAPLQPDLIAPPKKEPRLPANDDRKYFPQAKKF